jgi:hypothetical protein
MVSLNEREVVLVVVNDELADEIHLALIVLGPRAPLRHQKCCDLVIGCIFAPCEMELTWQGNVLVHTRRRDMLARELTFTMDLYFVRQQFTLGAYPALIALPLPDPSSSDYIPTLLYKIRAHLALGDNTTALALVPADTENVALRAAAALATGEQGLEALRDLCVELEGDEDSEEWEKEIVQVLAATAFVRAGEIEEALETLSAEEKTGDEPSAYSYL